MNDDKPSVKAGPDKPSKIIFTKFKRKIGVADRITSFVFSCRHSPPSNACRGEDEMCLPNSDVAVPARIKDVTHSSCIAYSNSSNVDATDRTGISC